MFHCFVFHPILVVVTFQCFILYVQDILKDYLDKRERGDLICQKRTLIADVLNQKVSYVDFVLNIKLFTMHLYCSYWYMLTDSLCC